MSHVSGAPAAGTRYLRHRPPPPLPHPVTLRAARSGSAPMLRGLRPSSVSGSEPMRKTIYTILATSILLLVSLASNAAAATVGLSVSTSGVGASLQMTPQGEPLGCDLKFCRYRFQQGETVTVTAQPFRGTFAAWGNACSTTAPVCKVVLDRSKTLYGLFSPVALTTVNLSPYEGAIQFAPTPLAGSCGAGCQLFAYGTRVRIAAVPAAFREFDSWGGACRGAGGPVCDLLMFTDLGTYPQFKCTGSGEDCASSNSMPLERSVKMTLVVRGSGSLRVTGRECGSTTCGTFSRTVRARTRSFAFQRGTMVTLRATSRRVQWGGICRGASPICQVVAFRDAAVAAPRITVRLLS